MGLSNNHLTGKIPSVYGTAFPRLKRFAASYNNLHGSIPSTFGKLVELQHLLLDNNELSGSLPTELSQCKNLGSVHLQGNQLGGVVAGEICDMISTTTKPEEERLQYISVDCQSGGITCYCCHECF